MAETPKDFYGSRERDRSLIEPRDPKPAEERWLSATERNPWSRAVLAITFLFFAALLAAIIVYQQQAIKDARQHAAEMQSPPLQLESHARTGIAVQVDPEGRIVLDEILDVAPKDVPATGAIPLTPHWVTQAAFHLRTAERASADENWTVALENYGQALRILPGIETVPEHMGLCYLRLQDYAKAETMFREAVGRQTNSPALLNNLGVAHMGQKNYAAAETDFRRATALDPGYAPARHNLALMYFRAGKMEQAVEVFAQSVKTDPNNADTIHMYAVALMKLDRWEDAAALLGESARANPTVAPIFFRLAEARSHTKDLAGAMKALHGGVDLVDVRTALLWLNRKEFNQLRDRPDFQQLLTELTKAIR